MKTAEQIAQQVIEHFDADNQTPEGERVGFGILADEDLVTWMIDAIKADREQRGIIAQVAEVLDDRGAHAAAQLVRDTDPDDDLWNNYIGPMIDSLEDDYTRMAKESA